MRDQKKLFLVVAGLVVLVGLIWLAQKSSYGPGAATPSPSVSVTPSPTVRRSPTPAGSVLPESYNDALVKYANRRMQFDKYCQAVPFSLSIQHGLSVMLDNRSGDARTFAVGGVFFTLPGYGWRIFTPYAKTLPGTIHIDCGSARNVGTIILQ